MLIHGITVKLHQRTQTGVDGLGVPIYMDTLIDVPNVLVTPASDTEELETVNLNGKEATYVLSIPRGDSHDWENTLVDFFGETWRTIGKPLEYIDSMLPLSWNKKVRVESIVSQN